MAPRKAEKEITYPEKFKKQTLILYLSIICLSICLLSYSTTQSIWDKYFKNTDAITTPFGIVYFNEKTDYLVRHEQCHYQRIQEEGALTFYSQYLLGEACIEELRCGAPISHPACSYPLSQIPSN